MGISTGDLDVIANGVAGFAARFVMAERTADAETRRVIEESLKAEGGFDSILDLTMQAASVIQENDLGWFKRNLYFRMIVKHLVGYGVPQDQAEFIKDLIEQHTK